MVFALSVVQGNCLRLTACMLIVFAVLKIVRAVKEYRK